MKHILLITLSLLLITPVLRAEDTEAPAPRKTRPKVGLVFSGGGAKGIAHIGVLKVLEEAGIHVDYVVGTSIGSIIGGIYALGYNASEMDSIVRAQDWDLLMRDQVSRTDVSYGYKEDNDKYLVTLPFMNRQGLTEQTEAQRGRRRGLLRNVPAALVEGQNLDQLFTKLSVGYQDDIDFNTLPIPFACVAVDLNTKEEVVFHRGDIVTAIRSSMSIPGYFAPVRVGDRYLVDGGMLNNLPVDVCREMGADYIITVDLHHFKKDQERETEQTIPEMVGTMLSIMNGEKYQAGRKASDILIEPNTSEYGVLSFDDVSVNALVDSGVVAAQRVLPQLRSLAEHLKEFPDRERPRPRKAIDLNHESVRISQLEASGTDAKEINWLLSKTHIAPGQMISGEDMDKAMAFIYNTRCFTKATYDVAGNEEEGYRLKVNLRPQRIHQAGIGFRFDTEEMASILLGMSLNKRKLFGSKLDAEVKLGANLGGLVRYGYTFHNLTRINVAVSAKHDVIDFYDYYTVNDGVRDISQYSLTYTDRYNIFTAQADYQITGWSSADIDLGVQYTGYSCRVVEGKAGEQVVGYSFRYNLLRGFLNWRLDTMDETYFPNRGIQIDLVGDARFNPEDRLWGFDPQFNLKAAIPLGARVTLIPQTYNRWVFGPNYRYFSNMVGGYMAGRHTPWQMPFVGINHTFKCLNNVDIARLDLRVNLFKQHYLTLMGNYMANWFPGIESASSIEHYYGFGLGYSINTIVGPVKLIAHWSNLSKRVGIHFALGYDF